MAENLPPILPVGTTVVTLIEIGRGNPRAARPPGAVGRIVQTPSDPADAYQVRFPDGLETSLRRNDMQVMSLYQPAGLSEQTAAEWDWSRYVIYRCVIGSRAYGLERDASDTDYRGVYLPRAAVHWSIYGVPEQLENDAAQECYWEIAKFIKLALKANPNVLETLYSPIVEHIEPIGQALLDIRQAFLSKLVFQTFNGYALSQFRKMEQDIRNHGQVKWKHAMHLIRLLMSGIQVLREGELRVQVGENREPLLAVRDGLVPWDELERWRLSLHREFEQAAERTRLPEGPDYAAANALLIRARRLMAEREEELS
ncbi:MAG: nucleotidyltransferase domain-containing protein [Tepidisphaeraceae bacterium]